MRPLILIACISLASGGNGVSLIEAVRHPVKIKRGHRQARRYPRDDPPVAFQDATSRVYESQSIGSASDLLRRRSSSSSGIETGGRTPSTVSESFHTGKFSSFYSDSCPYDTISQASAGTRVNIGEDLARVIPGMKIETSAGLVKLDKNKPHTGTCGSVYMGTLSNWERELPVAVKFEAKWVSRYFNAGQIGSIEYEYSIMKKMQDVGFPIVYAHNFHHGRKYYVMENVGTSIDDIMIESEDYLEPSFAISIALEVLKRIKRVHAKGYVINDMHLSNVMLSHRTGAIYLIDLAYATRFRDKNGRHIEEDRKNNIPKALRDHPLGSRNLSLGKRTSRRDDIERLLYLVLSMMESLPWARKNRETKQWDVVAKISAKPEEFCANHPWLVPMFHTVFKMGFKDDPPYSDIANLFQTQLMQLRHK